MENCSTEEKEHLSLTNMPRVGDLVWLPNYYTPHLYLVIQNPVVSWLNSTDGYLVEFLCVDMVTQRKGLQCFEQYPDICIDSDYRIMSRFC